MASDVSEDALNAATEEIRRLQADMARYRDEVEEHIRSLKQALDETNERYTTEIRYYPPPRPNGAVRESLGRLLNADHGNSDIRQCMAKMWAYEQDMKAWTTKAGETINKLCKRQGN
ncbi:hypothetical protein AFLA70_701g000332 [Aspergillus flavus AF70]|nr:hypothetical protein AFLA70_701g000332 [Aspergillus flavus AF70]